MAAIAHMYAIKTESNRPFRPSHNDLKGNLLILPEYHQLSSIEGGGIPLTVTGVR
jgi:hypothetical protein